MKWVVFFFNRHAQAFISTLGTLVKRPWSTGLTTLVLGTTLALPSFLLLSVQHLQQLSQAWTDLPSLTLFLHAEVSEEKAKTWVKTLQHTSQFDQVEFLHKDQALLMFQNETLFEEVADTLGENPLPHIITITLPTQPHQTTERMVAELQQHAFADAVLWDQQWIDKLHSVLTIIEQVTWVIALFLGSVVLLVLGNTIRLDIENKRQEIQVMRVLGATDAFIKRPFLYYGAGLGLLGGLFAIGLTLATAELLQPAIEQLMQQYETTFEFSFFAAIEICQLLLVSTSLGYIGAWLAVTRQIYENPPMV